MPVPFTIDDCGVDEFVRLASDFGQDKYGFAVTPNVDHLIRYHDDAAFRALYGDGDYILLDSRFLSFLFALTKGVRAQVCTGSDLTAQLFAKVMKPADPIILIGGEDAQAKSLADRYGLKNLRHFIPPMGFIRDPAAVEECLQFIEQNSPFRFCLLGVGAPQQEILAQRLKTRGKARGLALCIGASINFLTGAERRAPRWMQRIGTEWVFRLAQNPGRLAKRYLVRGPRVFALLRRTDIVLRPPVSAGAITTTGEIRTPESI
jgi:N-acetylglucosaminyldiphosphoundecaprenol N-acetyl-beta-D-mannosaminyltransferase